jgi:dipeptidyl-peptidase-4
MKSIVIKTLCIILIAGFSIPLSGQKKELSLEQIFKGEAYNIIKDIPMITGWDDNTHYIEFTRDAGKPVFSLVNVKTGNKTSYEANKERVFVDNNDIFYIDSQGNKKQLTKTEAHEKNSTLSPDKQWVAFTRDNNLYALNLTTGKEVQYTTDGSDVILNGYASWVYYEEILGRSTNYSAFWWSPDSKYIAFFRSDDSKVPVFPIYSAEGHHGYLENTHYPKAGDPNPEIKTGIVPVEGGKIVWADFNEKDDQYFGQPFWTLDSRSFWMQWMPREQNNLKIYAIDIATGSKKEVYDEKQHSWIDWKNDVYFLSNNAGYILQSDVDGWDQIYLYTMDGTLKQKLTSGKLWRTRILNIDEKNKTVYYTSCAEISTRTDFYSVKFDGKDLKRLSFGDYTHQVRLSPDAKYFITTYSNVSTPPRTALYEINKTKLVRELTNAKGDEFDNYTMAMPEIVSIQTPDGFNLPAVITLPVNLDPNKKYPVIINVYGGPNSASVSDNWKGIGSSQWWAKEGLIQITIDHRGSGHAGKKGLNYMYRNLGKWEMEDYTQWVKWLHTKPYIDQKKIAITGGSYGGYVTALALTHSADYFNYGIADFGVMDWMLYDSHYTERYMDTPESNPEGYKVSSVLQYVDKYKSGEAMLRIVHGTSDDNVHLQNSIQLVKALQKANKTFEMMLYPDCRHGWRGPQRTHNRNEIFRFYYQYLLNKEMPKEVYLQN